MTLRRIGGILSLSRAALLMMAGGGAAIFVAAAMAAQDRTVSMPPPLEDGVYLFVDPEGVIPSADLLRAIALLGEERARVIAVPQDPARAIAEIGKEDGFFSTFAAQLELDGKAIAFFPLDPDAPDVLEALAVRSLPALVVVHHGHAHVREGAAPANLDDLTRDARNCKKGD